jgi:hypothetical protein
MADKKNQSVRGAFNSSPAQKLHLRFPASPLEQMKTHSFSIIASVLAVSSAFAQAPVKQSEIKIERLKVEMLKTPQIQAQGLPNKRVLKAGEWLEVEVELSARVDVSDVSLKFHCLIQNPDQSLSHYIGDVTHTRIPKGRDRHSAMFLDPRTIDSITEGKSFSLNTNVKAAWVELKKGGEDIDLKFEGNGVTQQNVKAALDGGKAREITGSFLSKNQTPFGLLLWDYYEPVKQ